MTSSISRRSRLSLFSLACAPVALAALTACGGSAPAPATPSTSAAVAPSKDQAPAYGTMVSEAPAPAEIGARIEWAMAGKQRTDKERARDPFRHPKETLGFFGLKDGMTVIELWPGTGWYTSILAPTLRDHGKLFITGVDPAVAKGESREHELDMEKRLQGAPGVYDQVQIARIDPPNDLTLGAPESADMVLTFRNVHGFLNGKYADKLFGEAFKVLKHGGVFGVVEHRAAPGADMAKVLDSGYVPEDYVVKLAETAGFKLDAKSEINANAKDDKNHPGGVWALPPSFRNKDKDHDKYAAIGESDRMTLRFVKP